MYHATFYANSTSYVLELDDEVTVLDLNPPDDETNVLDCPTPDWMEGAPPRTGWHLLMLLDTWLNGSDDLLAQAGIRVVEIISEGKPLTRCQEWVRSPQPQSQPSCE